MSQNDYVKQVLEALEVLKNRDPNDTSDIALLASYLYTAIPELSEHLSKLKKFVDLNKPTQDDIQKAGYLLEEIALLSFCGLSGYTSLKSFRSPSSQYDLVIGGDTVEWKSICDLLYIEFNQRDIVVEAKATTEKLSDSQFARLCCIMSYNLTNTSLGVFFTLNGASGFPEEGKARQQKIGNSRLRQVVFHAATKKAIVVFDKYDILTLDQNGSLITLLIRKIRDLCELTGKPNAPVEEFVEVDLPESPSRLKQLYEEICIRQNTVTS
ncbi:hypothetical protein [Pseudanabaena sp. PCC 6802]|uniref:hypothetical protein n=1 Tax=Pseudanabaena sp. PCC 6802 TaxID=118173 RepID=UPI00034CE1FD|nr:hypothetical protein [Pseudanabaena sp. PCC 6802]